MAYLYGDGKPLRAPAWVTGNETPSQRDRRLQETNEALKNNRKREQERRNRELFTQLERQAELRFESPPSPPRGPDTPLDPEEEIRGLFGSQDRFERLLDSRLGGYEDTFGLTPLFGSQAYDSAERLALEDFREEQSKVPDDLLAERQVGLFVRSREFREGRELPPRNVDSKYDILVDSIKADIDNDAAVDTWLRGIEKDIRKDNPDADDQIVREQLYRTIRVQEHLSDVLDEWGFPQGEDIGVPLGAVDEALRREAEENGEFFKDFPDRPGLIESILDLAGQRFIPTVDPSQGFKPTFATLGDVHRGGQVFADPVTRGAIGTLTAPIVTAEAFSEGRLPTINELRDLDEGGPVSAPLRSQLAEDIVSEIISPEYIAIALPFASVGLVARGAGFARLGSAARISRMSAIEKTTRIAANLLGTGLEPGLVRGTMRGLSAFARNPAVLANIPRSIRQSELFVRGVENLRAAQATVLRRSGVIPGADDPVRFRRVLKDLAQGNPSVPDNIPLRQAIESDLSTGRSVPDLIENGLTPPTPRAGVVEETVGEITNFWRGEEGGGLLGLPFRRMDDNERVTRALTTAAEGRPPAVSLTQMRKSTNNTLLTKLADEEVNLASYTDLIDLARANRVDVRALGKLKADELQVLARQVLSPEEIVGANMKTLRTKLKVTVKGADKIRTRLTEGAFPELTRTIQIPTTTGRRGQKALLNAFDEGFGDIEARERELQKFLKVMRDEEARAASPFQKKLYSDDASYVEYSFRMQQVDDFNSPIWMQGQEEVLAGLKTIARGHRGSPEKRLAKLDADTATELKKDVRRELRALGGQLEPDDLEAFERRLMTTRLDIHDATVLGREDIHFDVGRRLKVLIEHAGAKQDDINRTFKGLRTIVEEGKTPSSERLLAMERTMGREMTLELLKARKASVIGGEITMDVIGLPRVLMTTMDMSAMFRQGAVLAAGHPFLFANAVKESFRIFPSERAAIRLNDSLRFGRGSIKLGDKTEDLYDLTTRLGLYQAPWDAQGTIVSISGREEALQSKFASIFGLKMPERAFILFLNKLRADVADNAIRGWARTGRPPSDDEMRQFMHFVNVATGRGRIPQSLEGIAPLLNAAMFSPRLALSRFQVVGDTARAFMTPGSRASQMIIKDMTAFTGTNLIALSLGQIGGLWELEVDPTKADFLKVRIGNTSIDPWAGFKPYATYFARMTEALSRGDFDRLDNIVQQLARSKLAPVPSGVWDVISGRDFIGRPVKWNTLDFDNAFVSRVTPLIVQDVVEALEEAEFKTLETPIVAGAAFIGLGAVTYRRLGEELEEARNASAQDKFGLDYADQEMDDAKQDDVDRDPEVADLAEEVKQDRLERGNEFAENSEEESQQILSIRTTGATLDGTKVTDFTQKQIDDSLERGDIDGNTWIETDRQIRRDIRRWRLGFQEARGINFKDDPPEEGSLQAVIEAWWDLEPETDPFTLEQDFDAFFEEKDRLQAQAESMQVDGEVARYFKALGEDDTDTQMRFKVARDQRDVLLDETPAYMAGVSDVTIDNLLDSTKEYLLSVGSRWGLARYIQWLYYQDEQYQTNEWAIAYWVALGERDEVVNPERTQIVLENPDLVLFYSGLFRGLTDDGRQGFVNRYGTTFLSKSLLESFIESGEITRQTSETELFRPQPLFQS